MFTNYLVFEDTMLNSNDKVVNAITKRIISNDGFCPCHQSCDDIEDTRCPCKSYRESHYCCCSLYVKR